MTRTITFFDTENDLSALTGLDHDQLWDAGFNLDDWDFGFVVDKPLSQHYNAPRYDPWLDDHMDCYCCGSRHVQYGGQHYYMAYHS